MRTRALGIVCIVAGCANNVPQDRSTGPDGRLKGAVPIVLEENEGRVRGIVTYPGGDRVDWRSIELPEGTRGKLDLQMTFTTPRPGLKVTFDVFDQWNTPVSLAMSGRGRIRSGTIEKAKGKYFVRIYAPRRGDAGSYKLTAEYKPEPPPVIFNPLDIEVSLPPRLPDVPTPPVACTTHDPSNPECDKVCAPGAPTSWKGCPPPPVTTTTPPTTTTPTPPLPPPADPITTRMMKMDTVGGGIEITVPVGSSSGVTKTWKARVLRGETTASLPGGSGTIVRVNARYTVVRVALTPDQLNANPNVVLSP